MLITPAMQAAIDRRLAADARKNTSGGIYLQSPRSSSLRADSPLQAQRTAEAATRRPLAPRKRASR